MVVLRQSLREELRVFSEIELDDDTSPFVIPYSIDEHRDMFSKPESRYLSIHSQNRFAGFILLLLEPDNMSVEFRRIVVVEKGRGIGQSAINQVDAYCKNKLHRSRIWLDVFENNDRARHVYEKCGYKQFKVGEYHGRTLCFYEKAL